VQYLGIEALLIIVFTYFYTAVQFNPVDQADNLRKYGGYIPGSVPGRQPRSTRPGALAADAAGLDLPRACPVLPGIFIFYFHFSERDLACARGTSVIIVSALRSTRCARWSRR